MKTRHKLREAIDLLYARGCASSESNYTRLVLDCVRQNDVSQAKRLQSHMELHLYEPTSTFLYNRLIHVYSKAGQLSDAQKLFDRMPKRDIFTYNAMLSAYSKLGSVKDLWALFDKMPSRDPVSYNTVIAGLASSGCERMALEVFVGMQKEGFEPTEYTYVSVLNVCSKLSDLKFGRQVHGRIVGCNLGGNVFICNALTDMYAKCGEIDAAGGLFDQMLDKNLVSWNSMITGYLKSGQPQKCIDLFHKMQLSGVKPDAVTISNVLGAFFQNKCIDEAQKIFREFSQKDEVCWTSMIVGYVQNGYEENAIGLFGEMLLENVRPDSFTISSVINSCAKLAHLYNGQTVHGKAIHMGVDSDLLVASAFIDMYSKCGESMDASTVFSEMPTKNLVSWNSMILGYAQNGKDAEALALYEEMLQENLKPDNITFVGILSACIHAGFYEKGQAYFLSISKLHGMTPTLDHYASMINLLGRSGRMCEAVNLIKGMPHEPNQLIWSTILSLCAMNGDVKNGEVAAKKLFELDPLNAGPYIMLSNMYAADKRWKDVAFIRSLMKNKNVKKFAAYSWTEIDGKVHKFVAEDRVHPETKEIYQELHSLIERLLDAGFTLATNLVLHEVGENEKLESICYHSEKLALAFGLIKKPHGQVPIRIMKNIRVCLDCHKFMKYASKVVGRYIILRDSHRFHHFNGGQCSCKDLW